MAETDQTLGKIRALATAMRLAFDSSDRNKLMDTLKPFPKGGCGDASLLLAQLLEDHGCGQFDYILCDREGGGSHAWLQRGELVVDITADQFNEGVGPVFVAIGSSWHAGQHGRKEHNAELSAFGSDWERKLLGQYRYVRGLIPDSALVDL